jgi:hypothetical protein
VALQSVKFGVALPEPPSVFSGSFSALTMDASGEKVAFVFEIPKTGTISKVLIRTATVTSSETLNVGLQTIDDTTGFPTGSAYGGMTAGTQAAPAASTAYAVTLGGTASATAGDRVAAVIAFDSAVGNLQIAYQNASTVAQSFPYSLLFTSSWSKMGGGYPCLAIEYNDGTYENIYAVPYSLRNSVSFNSGSTPDERALRFEVPWECRVSGCWSIMGGSGNFDYVLYEGTTAKVTVSVDASVQDAGGAAQQIYRCRFPTPYTLAANTEYFMAVKPTSGTNTTLLDFEVLSAAVMDSFHGGQDFHFASRTDAGAWTPTTTKRPLIGLYLDQFHDGAGGGGGGLILPRSMNGGLV